MIIMMRVVVLICCYDEFRNFKISSEMLESIWLKFNTSGPKTETTNLVSKNYGNVVSCKALRFNSDLNNRRIALEQTDDNNQSTYLKKMKIFLQWQ